MKLVVWGLQAAVIWASLLPTACSAGENPLRLKVNGKRNPPSPQFNKRGNIVGSSTLANSADVSYYANVTLGGSSFSVLIDTGSSDLWVAGSVSNVKETGKTSGVTYAIGSVQGPVLLADLNFTGYIVNDQAFIQVTPDSTNPQGLGLIGLGPNQGSNVFSALGTSGAAVVDRIFRQNTSTPNFVSVLLGRSDDPTDTFPGDITVGDILDGYGNITSQTKLDVTQVSTFNSGSQHWQSLVDEKGILGPDGQPISLTTVVSKTADAYKLTAVFDTGFTLPQVPESLATAVYGRIPGAQFVNRSDVGGIWELPCDREVNMTFIFGGQKIPIHPLDTSIDLNVTDDSGNKVCLGAFQPITASAQDSNYDLILGMAFLRNVYMLINYGDFVDGTSNTANPYIQFLATTEPVEAHQDFVNVRLGGKDDANWQLLPPSSTGSSSKGESQFVRRIKYYWPVIAGVAGFLILILILACLCARRRRRRGARPFWGGQKSYHPLNDPAPVGMQPLAHQGAGRPSTSDYRNPWDPKY